MQAGSSLIYYRDVMVYNGNTLSYVLHPEGILRKSAMAWVYDYMLSDHTGSTRVVLEANYIKSDVTFTYRLLPILFTTLFPLIMLDSNRGGFGFDPRWIRS